MGLIITLIRLILLPFMIIDWIICIVKSRKVDKTYREEITKAVEEKRRKENEKYRH